jgi:hypothetical protein
MGGEADQGDACGTATEGQPEDLLDLLDLGSSSGDNQQRAA